MSLVRTVSLATLFIISNQSFAKDPNFSSKNVIINYQNNIHGYQVKVNWTPKTLSNNSEYVMGPARIEFYKGKNVKPDIVNTNYFSIKKNRLPINFKETDDTISINRNYNFTLTYFSNDRINSTVALNEPFFFQDINFDGKEELIFPAIGMGQRFRTKYEIFQQDKNRWSKMTTEPFASLDSEAKIDFKNKTIQTDESGGACDSSFYTYTFNKPEHKITLSHITETTSESGECKQLEYKVEQGVKKLMSEKIVH